MSLTLGTAPFGQHADGAFNFELPRSKGIIYFERSPRRIRAVFAGETIVDSPSPSLLHEQNLLPVDHFPRDDVRMDLLEPTQRSTHCPFKGDASYWSVRVGEQVARTLPGAIHSPIEGAPHLSGYLAFYWDRMDQWFEEDEPESSTLAT